MSVNNKFSGETGEYKVQICLFVGHSPPKGGVISYSIYGLKTQVAKRIVY
jgi:hypothetical protein